MRWCCPSLARPAGESLRVSSNIWWEAEERGAGVCVPRVWWEGRKSRRCSPRRVKSWGRGAFCSLLPWLLADSHGTSSPGGMHRAARSSHHRRELEQESSAWRQQNRLPLGGSPLQRFHFMTFFHSARGGKKKKKRHKQILGLPLASPQAAAPLPKQGLCGHWKASVLGTATSCISAPFIPSVFPALPSASSVLPAAPPFLPLSLLSSLHLLPF